MVKSKTKTETPIGGSIKISKEDWKVIKKLADEYDVARTGFHIATKECNRTNKNLWKTIYSLYPEAVIDDGHWELNSKKKEILRLTSDESMDEIIRKHRNK